MRIVKLGKGRRKIGDVVVEQENLPRVREVVVDSFEEYWEPVGSDIPVRERSPISQRDGIVAYPGRDGSQVYMHIVVENEMIDVPGRDYVLKLLQLL